ncbi:MAG: response regulator [Desulfovibrio sp.]|nr:response regulator [Desulfovibrio sp.]
MTGRRMHVLFVDDEEKVLRGLQRMLRGHVDWAMGFALSGQQALEVLAEKHVDVIVADMRMPGMDGVHLLNEVQKRFPGVVRIVLSGHSDQQAVLHMARPAHQFLSKPCDRETLIATLERVHALRDVFTNARLREVMTRIDSLPVLPTVFQKLVDELESEDPSVERAGRILGMDAALSAGVLKTVNSAFFGLPRQVATPDQAVALLGLDVLKGLVVSGAMFSMFQNKPGLNFSLDNLWKHSVRVGGFGRVICGLLGCDSRLVEQAFLCGLLHDLGKLALADSLPEEYSRVLALSEESNIPIREAELEVLQTDHADLGAYLLGLWGFGEDVVRAVAGHHDPSKIQGGPVAAVTTTHIANYVDHLLVVLNQDYAEHPLDTQYVIRAGLVEQLPAWVEACHSILQREQHG